MAVTAPSALTAPSSGSNRSGGSSSEQTSSRKEPSRRLARSVKWGPCDEETVEAAGAVSPSVPRAQLHGHQRNNEDVEELPAALVLEPSVDREGDVATSPEASLQRAESLFLRRGFPLFVQQGSGATHTERDSVSHSSESAAAAAAPRVGLSPRIAEPDDEDDDDNGGGAACAGTESIKPGCGCEGRQRLPGVKETGLA